MAPVKLINEIGKGYSLIPPDKMKDGWVSVDDFLPIAFDLVLIKKGFLDRCIKGWWSGNYWLGARVAKGMEFQYWKHSKEDL